MRSFKVSPVLGIVLACVVLLLVTVRRYEVQLQANNESLRRSASQIAELKEQNSRLLNQTGSAANWKLRAEKDLAELTRLRAEVSQLRREKKENGQARGPAPAKANETQSQTVPAPAGAGVSNGIPKDAWAFAGYQTPANALESVMWAMKNGDVNTFLSSLTPEAQEEAAKTFEGMSDAEIAAWLQLQSEMDGLDTLPLDRVQNVSDTEAAFVLYSEETDDGTVKTRDEAVATFMNIGGEWRFTGF
jgi:hypothetical protein